MVHTLPLRGHMVNTLRLRIHTTNHLHMLYLQVAGLYLRTHHLRGHMVNTLRLRIHTRHMVRTPHHLLKSVLQAPGPMPRKQSYQSVQRG